MKYEEFIRAVQAEVEQRLGDGVHTRLRQVTKNNDVHLDGLSFFEEGSTVAPTVYLNDYYEEYEEGKRLEEIADFLVSVFESSRGAGGFQAEAYVDFEKAKNHLACKLINRDRNGKLLEQVPWKPFLNLAVVVYYKVEDESSGYGTILVQKSHCASWGIQEEKLFLAARENMIRMLPASFLSIGCMIGEEETDEEAAQLYVLTNRNAYLGAAEMIYDAVLAKIGEKLQQDFWVLPSSIHECIVVPVEMDMTADELGNLVAEVNAREVVPEDYLSDEVYFYHRKLHRLMMVKRGE